MDSRVLITIVTAAITIAIGVFPLMQRRDHLVVYFAAYNLFLALWGLAVLVPIFPVPEHFRLPIFRLFDGAGVLAVLSFFRFMMEFLRLPREKFRVPWMGLLVGGLFLGSLAFTPHLIADVDWTSEPFREIPGKGMPLFIAFMIFGTGFPLVQAIQTFRRSHGAQRTQIAYLFLALSFILAEMLAYTITLYYRNLPPYYFFLQILYSLTLAYAMARHRLMEIGLILRYAVLYLIFAFFLTLPIAAASSFSASRETLIALVFLTLFFAPLIERKAFGTFRWLIEKFPAPENKFHYLDTLPGLKKAIVSSPSIKQWALHLAAAINRLLEVENVVVFILDESNQRYFPAVGIRADTAPLIFASPSVNDPLIRRLTASGSAFQRNDIHEVDSSLESSLSASMHLIKSEVCLPFFNGKDLLGFVSLGRKMRRGAIVFAASHIRLTAFQNLLEWDTAPAPGSAYLLNIVRHALGVPFPLSPSTLTAGTIADVLNGLANKTGWVMKTPDLDRLELRGEAAEARDRFDGRTPLLPEEERLLSTAVLEHFFGPELSHFRRGENFSDEDLRTLENFVRGAESALWGILGTLAEELKTGGLARDVQPFINRCLRALEAFIAGKHGPLSPDQLRRMLRTRTDAAISKLQIDRILGAAAPTGKKTDLFEAGDFLSAAVKPYGPLADAAGIGIQVLPPTGSCPLKGDPEFLQHRVFNILLDNALERTPPGGRLELGATSESQRVELYIKCVGAAPLSEEAADLIDAQATLHLLGGCWEAGGIVEGGTIFRLFFPSVNQPPAD